MSPALLSACLRSTDPDEVALGAANLRRALLGTGGDVTAAARLLRVPRTTFRRWLSTPGLEQIRALCQGRAAVGARRSKAAKRARGA